MRRVSETNILYSFGITTVQYIVNGKMLLRSDRRFSDFPFHTKTVLENIHINKARGYYTKLNDTKNSDIPGNELDECGFFFAI